MEGAQEACEAQHPHPLPLPGGDNAEPQARRGSGLQDTGDGADSGTRPAGRGWLESGGLDVLKEQMEFRVPGRPRVTSREG